MDPHYLPQSTLHFLIPTLTGYSSSLHWLMLCHILPFASLFFTLPHSPPLCSIHQHSHCASYHSQFTVSTFPSPTLCLFNQLNSTHFHSPLLTFTCVLSSNSTVYFPHFSLFFPNHPYSALISSFPQTWPFITLISLFP